ncbi:MAG: HPr family phosphocarrier protein [Erysipelotrichaceae bacterium]|jgi:phosphocarrier protein|nr:HPr family phosphocarrier protein [Erysipelotrichaceae bacterium]
MKSFTYVITDKEGIHARPAGIVVAEAKKYASAITIENKGKKADLKRIFAVMSLCVKNGEEIKIVAEGADEEAAAAGVEKVLKENL